jgi:hypothetical protein
MAVPRWTPRAETTKQEERRLAQLARTRKLLVSLRQHRMELFDEAFQAELAAMYRETGEGEMPVPPAMLAMTLLLQAYEGVGDARAIERTWSDKGWQMVLAVQGSDEPAFGQGTLQAFRERLIAHDMDRRLLERTVELAKQTEAFDYKKLPKTLRLGARFPRDHPGDPPGHEGRHWLERRRAVRVVVQPRRQRVTRRRTVLRFDDERVLESNERPVDRIVLSAFGSAV